MFPFWGPVVAPLLEAAEVRRVVEIGALRGDNTRQMIERLGPDAVLHVVDPVPGFDPAAHEREFPGRYVFHQALSLDVLGELPPMDAALIDGDHNWYTVVNELRLLRDTARQADAPLPLLVLHDVGWPYGRRDLYYSPETIPAEHRQPHRRAGMRPGRRDLLPDGQGMSSGLWNAEVEGGPRNGVMTALDDFVAEHDRALRTVVLPVYFGLAIVVEQERLERQPALVAELERIEGPTGKQALIEMGEQLRLRAIANHHTVVRRNADRIDRLAGRYLDGVVRTLEPDAPAGTGRLARFRRQLDAARLGSTPGDVVVVSGGDPVPAAFGRAYLAAHDLDDRALWVIDPSSDGAVGGLDAVGEQLRRLDLSQDGVHLVDVGSTVLAAGDGPEQVAVLFVGGDSGAGVEQALDRLAAALAPAGSVVLDDSLSPAAADGWAGVRLHHDFDAVVDGRSGADSGRDQQH